VGYRPERQQYREENGGISAQKGRSMKNNGGGRVVA
jgi:hypothetical protein